MLFFVLRAACLPLCQAEEKQEMQRGESRTKVESRVKAEKERESREARRMQIQLPCESNSAR